jgi:hypothetical protein
MLQAWVISVVNAAHIAGIAIKWSYPATTSLLDQHNR